MICPITTLRIPRAIEFPGLLLDLFDDRTQRSQQHDHDEDLRKGTEITSINIAESDKVVHQVERATKT